MISPLDAIGLSDEQFEDCKFTISEQAVVEAESATGLHLRWTDTSGASLALHVVDGMVVCVNPFFDPWMGLSRWQVTTSEPGDDDHCAHCGGADCDILVDGEMVTRAFVQWLHCQPCRQWLEQERTYDLEVVAIAERVEIHADEDAFRCDASTSLGGLRLAPDGFIPVGMFDRERKGPAAGVLMAGRVTGFARLQNPFGGVFWHLRLQALPGLTDVVVPEYGLQEEPGIGQIALVQAWLIGRPVQGPGQG